MMHSSKIPALLLVLLFVFAAPAAWACVGCRAPGESLGNQDATIQAGIALSWSVMFLLAVVVGVLTFLGAVLSKAIREADRRTNFPET